eukprot:TRINITY_DN54584_c0_g1_i4.p1 TRINITY_DN54584_c0_g1~~TRINITY_DN54584_c0_g1_i4.p1  ORF type:complete len:177 (+),score=36.90 TRINITY_DN54584_c0_g1_i4:126-656(+)
MLRSLVGSEMCIRDRVEETAKVIAASRVDTISQLHSKVNHQLNRAALGPSGTGALSGPSGPVTQDVSLGGAATSKKGGGGGATGVDRPPRGRGGAQNTTASGSQALDGSGATSGPFPVCGDISGVMGGSASSSIATISVACLLYTSDAADEEDSVDLGGRRIIKKKKRKKKQGREL